MNWLTVVFGAAGTLGGVGGGLVALLQVRATRRRIIAESQQLTAKADETVASTVKVLLGGAADLVQPLQRQLDATEKRCDELDRKLRSARSEADKLAVKLHRLVMAIHDPTVTVDRLRTMVGPPSDNGR
jgi:uncharacterized protein Yka (UPF0111/DUF47 family)